jgi:membrane protease YdiL (CAAX protease family)
MDFNIKKPLHILALILVTLSFFFLIIVPILSFVGTLPSTQSIEYQQISESLKLISEIFFLVFQLALVFGLMVIIPFLWYFIVNNCNLKEIFFRIKLRSENIDKAFLWGILSAIIIFFVVFAIELIFITIGFNANDLSNIPDIEKIFSWPVIFFLVAIQPIAEEIFFRGFLFEKIENFAGSIVAILITAFLFGIAHMTYGKIFPVIMPILMGIILGYIVYKTKNLYSSMVAHITFNLISVTLAYIGTQLLQNSALIL